MPNIIINNICNQRCKYCFAEESMYKEALPINQQRLSTYISLLQFLRRNDYNDVRLLGGEPLLHPDIAKMVYIARAGGFQVRIFSNLNFPEVYIKKLFSNTSSFPHTINANINNRNFYKDSEYLRLLSNLKFFRTHGVIMTIGYNIYDLSLPFSDIASIAHATGINHINLKITNSILGAPLIIDTGSREYGKYIFSIIEKYYNEFEFVFSCGLSPKIFLPDEIDFMHSKGIYPKYGCEGFSGIFDIDIDGSIYKCFPTRSLYTGRKISIYNFSGEDALFGFGGIYKSKDVCIAHTMSK